MGRILLIDDDPGLREVLAFALREQGHEIDAHPTGESGLAALGSFRPDLVITDLKMPGVDGIRVLRAVREIDPPVPVVILTAFGSIEDAVEAMKDGAHDYLTKPYNRDELRLTVEHALERRRLVLENRQLRDRLREQSRRFEIVHASESMQRILETVKRIAPTDATVLITGESGTGKELIAHALHTGSERWDGSFVAVSCAAIPRDLMESELFGYARGAFTGATKDKPGKFQRADGGTLFLDEVGDLPADLQTKLLRVIETRHVDVLGSNRPVPVDVRLISATNADLGRRVADGSFRDDLYYRLNVIPIHVPPLRERPDDIPALWEHFVRRTAAGASIRTSPGLMRRLMSRPWPGNVRELANVSQRMVLLRASDLLDTKDLPAEAGDPRDPSRAPHPADRSEPDASGRPWIPHLPADRLPLFELERDVIERALAKHGGNRTRTAEYLGIPRHVLVYRLEKFGIV
jgi:two-component system NtrC family response regulator